MAATSKSSDRWKQGLIEFGKLGKPLKIKDAESFLKVRVSPHVVGLAKDADRLNGEACPFAIAANSDKAVRAVRVYIGNRIARFIFKVSDEGVTASGAKGTYEARRYTVPADAAKALMVWDNGGNFPPGDYIFTQPTPARRLGYYNDRLAKLAKKKGRVRTYTRRAPRDVQTNTLHRNFHV